MSGLMPTKGGIVGSILGGPLGGAFGDLKDRLKPNTPQVTAPTVMPDADDEAIQKARRRQIAEIQARSGRASTILTGGDQLGG